MNDSSNVIAMGRPRKVLLAGATGLVGRQLLGLLLADDTVDVVHAIGRRAPDLRHPKLRPLVVDFQQIPRLPAVDEIYLALGTTIRTAGSKQAFRLVDFYANVATVRAGVKAGARRVAVVSAVSADSSSRIFYNRVKGDLERALGKMPLEALVIARPSFLLGDRSTLQQPPRIGEKLGIAASLLLRPVLPSRYRPVSAASVAQAMLLTLPGSRGTRILASDEMGRLGVP